MTNKRRARILRTEYSAFRRDTVKHLSEKVLPRARAVFDPMAGTSPLIPYIEYYGLSAHFNDILPLHSFVNRAKTYAVYRRISEIEENDPGNLRNELCRSMSKLENKSLIISDKWIHDDVLNGLMEAWAETGRYEREIRFFFQATILLCAREYSCMSPSDKNPTWYRPGGMTTEKPLHDVVGECMERFFRYYETYYLGRAVRKASFHFSRVDIRSLETHTGFDTILTSPSYPNRYDYVTAYAPEIYFLSKCENTPGIEELRPQMLATNVVKDYEEHESDYQFVRQKSPKTGEFLVAVRQKQRPGENDYYFRFFVKYYSTLYRCLDRLISLLAPEGSLHIVVQNNIHRGELNRLGEFVSEYFLNQGLRVTTEFPRLRPHQGLRNISEDYPLVVKKHNEVVVRAEKC